MGKMTITEDVGEGLYKATLYRETKGLQAELDGLRALEKAYWRELNQALDHLKLLRRDQSMYRAQLDALIQQWKDILEQKTRWPPDPAEPEDADPNGFNPNTGEPYTDEERQDALADEMTDKINEERIASGLAPLVRSTTLDRQSTSQIAVRTQPVDVFPDFIRRDGYLEMLSRQQAIQAHGRTIHDAFLEDAPGVVFDELEEMLIAGPDSTNGMITALKRDPDSWAILMNPDLNEMGAYYQYNPAHPGTHLWNLTAAKVRGAPAGNSAFFADPAGTALISAIEDAIEPLQATALKEGKDGGSGGGGSGAGSWSEPWKANTTYGAGSNVMGKRRNGGGEVLALSGAYGTSGDTEPLWPAPGQGVADGQMTWTVLSNIPPEVAAPIGEWYG